MAHPADFQSSSRGNCHKIDSPFYSTYMKYQAGNCQFRWRCQSDLTPSSDSAKKQPPYFLEPISLFDSSARQGIVNLI